MSDIYDEKTAELAEAEKGANCPSCGFPGYTADRIGNICERAALLAMTENRDHWKQSAEDHSESATKWHAALQSSREEVRVLREALGKMPCNCAAERYGSHATNCGKRILSPAPSAPSEVKP